ncbi:MAG: energy transducer TonB [Lentimicrobium sp.]
MKRTFFLCWIIIMVIGANGQITRSYGYFNDVYCSKEVPQSKAKFKKVTSVSDDGLISVEVINIRTGKPADLRTTRNNLPSGIWRSFDKNGKVIEERNFGKLAYSDVKIKDGLYFEYSMDTKSNQTLDFTPAHFGTQEDRIKYLTENIRYPREARESGTQGMVILHVKITKTGELKVLSISKSLDPFIDYESWRVIESMPAWTPSFKDGEPVDSYTFIPIRYTLAG